MEEKRELFELWRGDQPLEDDHGKPLRLHSDSAFKLRHEWLKKGETLRMMPLCPSCGEAHQPPCPVRPCGEWEAIQAEERQERETILLREGTRRNLD